MKQRATGAASGGTRRLTVAFGLAAMLLGPAALHAAEPVTTKPTSFTTRIVDRGMAGDIKLVGDINRDGLPDMLVAGDRSEGARWYREPSLRSSLIARPLSQFTTDGALYDLDGDGDLDFVAGDGNGGNNLVWLENPLPGRSPADRVWARHVVGTAGGWVKDVEGMDVDRDGRADVVIRTNSRIVIFFGQRGGSWLRVPFVRSLPLGNEGMTRGDLDRDGNEDLVIRGAWLRNPGGAAARDPSRWRVYTIGPASTDFKALVADIDGDGRRDVVFSSSEKTADVRWWKAGPDGPTGRWTSHLIQANVNRAHTLQAGDVDRDGKVDVLVGQMHTSAAREVRVYYNQDGAGTRWRYQVIGTPGLHNGILADVDRDGDLDVFGSNWTGNPPVRLWLNNLR